MVQAKNKQWFTDIGLTKIKGWAQRGLIDEQIAHNMGISPATFYKWKNDFPEILEAVKKGKEVIDLEVENALLQRALGTDFTEVTREVNQKGKLVVTKAVDKHISGDTTAMIFWLKNRRPDLWREKQFQEIQAQVNADVEATHKFDKMSDDDIRKLLRGEDDDSE